MKKKVEKRFFLSLIETEMGQIDVRLWEVPRDMGMYRYKPKKMAGPAFCAEFQFFAAECRGIK